MNFNLNDFDENKSFNQIPAFLAPGSHELRLLSIWLEATPYDPSHLNVRMLVEGPAITDDFKGWQIDKDHPELGTYSGQIGTVSNGQYAFSDFVTKDGKAVKRDEQIFNWVCYFAKNIGKLELLREKVTGDYNNINDWVTDVAPVLCNLKDRFFLTIAGKEYINSNGYPAYRLFIPKNENFRQPACPGDMNEDIRDKKFLKFNPARHLIKQVEKKEIPVDSFAGAYETTALNYGGRNELTF